MHPTYVRRCMSGTEGARIVRTQEREPEASHRPEPTDDHLDETKETAVRDSIRTPTNPSTPTTTEDVECPLSLRVDGKKHSWRWNGDSPEIICVYCDEMRDALSDRVYRPGRRGNDGGAA